MSFMIAFYIRFKIELVNEVSKTNLSTKYYA